MSRIKRKIGLAGVAAIMIIGALMLVLFPFKKELITLKDPDDTTGPKIIAVKQNASEIGAYEKFELSLELQAAYENPYDPEELNLSAVFLSPGGKQWKINGFFDGAGWLVRFAPNEIGSWKYRLSVKDKTGTTISAEAGFNTVESSNHGWIQLSSSNKRYLEYSDGSTFYGIGAAYPWGITEDGLNDLADHGANLITYWNGNYDNAGNGGGNNQIESVGSGIGKYDVLKGFRMDELLDWFETRNLYMNFVIWPHDSLADQINGWPAAWKRSAYSTIGEAKDFYSSEEMWNYQEKLYRYIIARWGYSPHIAAWNLVTEVNGTDGWSFGNSEQANEWITKMQQFFKSNDPYGHPTVGSMAGGAEDYWDHGYKTLDIADRENYYDFTYKAIAKDVQTRWQQYEKPLFIGEIANVTDPLLYHNALWTALSNGLASTPIWWAQDKINAEMFDQMKVFSEVVKNIDFREPRTRMELATKTIQKQLDAEVLLEDGKSAEDWNMPDWPDANKDAAGTLYKPAAEDGTVNALMSFRSGDFSQGFLHQSGFPSDWSSYKELQFEIYVEHAGKGELKAKPVLLPDGNWTESNDRNDSKLTSGSWTTVTVPLADVPNNYWRDGKRIEAEQLQNISSWGVKLYTTASDKEAKPTVVKLRNPRLLSDKPPSVEVKEAQGWVMAGQKLSFGWLVTDEGAIGGKTAELKGFGEGEATISWYDPWNGEELGNEKIVPADGVLKLTAPTSDKRDIAFLIKR